MGSAYTIFGKQVPAYVLSMLTLSSVAAVAFWPRTKTAAAPVAAPLASGEDDFDLEKFLNDLTKEETK